MGCLVSDDPITAADFAALGVVLPLRVDPAYPGTIVDANDCDVCVVDHNGERSDADVAAIVDLILGAVNFTEFSA